MAQISRILCVECRRRKIKCNKLHPCNQCIKREIMCDYPKKFRKIDIDKLQRLHSVGVARTDSGATDFLGELDVENLPVPAPEDDEREVLLRKIRDLEKVINNLDLTVYDVNDPSINCYQGKYYGPTLAILMLSDFGAKLGPQAFIFGKNVHYQRRINVADLNLPLLNALLPLQVNKLIPKFHHDRARNQEIVVLLVEKFFLYDCAQFFDRDEVMATVGQRPLMNDEQFMVVLTMLLTTLLRDPELQQYERFIPGLISEFNILKKKLSLSLKVIHASLLLLEFYFFTMHSESAWQTLFSVVSDCYLLGLHIPTPDRDRLVVWWVANHYESMLCFILGRPNPIPVAMLLGDVGPGDREAWRVDVTLLAKETNMLLLALMQDTDYTKVEALLAWYDSVIARLQHTVVAADLWVVRLQLVVLLTNYAKLHQPFMNSRVELEVKIIPAIRECFVNLRQVLALTGGVVPYRRVSPFGDCHFFQTLAVFFTYLNHTKRMTEEVLATHTLLTHVVEEGTGWMTKTNYLVRVIDELIQNNLNLDYFSKAPLQPHLLQWYNLKFDLPFVLQMPETQRLFGELEQSPPPPPPPPPPNGYAHSPRALSAISL